MFKDALAKLRKTLDGNKATNIQKSNIGDLNEEEEGVATIEDPNEEGGGVDIGDLTNEAVVMFETGELQPDIDAVGEWARERGLPDSDIDEFSSSLIDSYFAGTYNMELEEINKSILALREGQSILAEGLNTVLEKDKKTSELETEISVLKSKLSILEGKPDASNPKTPVIESESNSNKPQQIQKGFSPGDPMQSKELELTILKGIKAGSLSLEEMSFFEATGKLSENAASYINSQKLVSAG